jgi:hypothetical protein
LISHGRLAFAGLAILSCAQMGLAQNTTAGGALPLTVGQVHHSTSVDGTATQRWFILSTVAGRSYCVEATMGVTQETWTNTNDPELAIFKADGTTLLASNGDVVFAEPGGHANARACLIAPATEFARIRVVAFTSGQVSTYEIRAVETTLFSNWFFLGGDYGAFTLLRNTMNTAVNYTINWRNTAGAIVATSSGSLAGNGSALLNARSFPGAVSAGSGTVEIVHNGSMDAIMATTTVLSTTTGLSFDTIFTKRTAW